MSDNEGDLDIFQEPRDYYPPEKEPTYAQYTLLNGQHINLRLVGHNPLWGHLLWNAGQTISKHIEEHASTLISGKTVLELGAGAGLPSLVCAIKGASTVVVTDYPDADLVENLRYNIEHCPFLPSTASLHAEGYLWGATSEKLLSYLPQSHDPGFDLLILADLLFNHSEHGKLLTTVQQTLMKTASSKALVFFTPYRPWLLQKDLAFFEAAREGGFDVRKILEKVMDKVMFEEDPGVRQTAHEINDGTGTNLSAKDELIRRTVFGYELVWRDIP